MLLNPCKYSFDDLLIAAGHPPDTTELYTLSQFDRNKTVKKLCDIAGWYYEDMPGNDGIIYTAFSPYQIKPSQPIKKPINHHINHRSSARIHPVKTPQNLVLPGQPFPHR